MFGVNAGKGCWLKNTTPLQDRPPRPTIRVRRSGADNSADVDARTRSLSPRFTPRVLATQLSEHTAGVLFAVLVVSRIVA